MKNEPGHDHRTHQATNHTWVSSEHWPRWPAWLPTLGHSRHIIVPVEGRPGRPGIRLPFTAQPCAPATQQPSTVTYHMPRLPPHYSGLPLRMGTAFLPCSRTALVYRFLCAWATPSFVYWCWVHCCCAGARRALQVRAHPFRHHLPVPRAHPTTPATAHRTTPLPRCACS